MEPRLENAGARGRLLDENGEPLAGLLVTALDERLLLGERVLGTTTSGRDGRFHVAYDPVSRHSLLRSAPNLRILVYDRRGIRLLAESQLYEGERAPVLDLDDLTLPRCETQGWLATNGTGRPVRLTQGNRLEFLVDNEAAFGAAAQAMARARRSINLTQLYFDPVMRAAFRDPEVLRHPEAVHEKSSGTAPEVGDLVEALVAATQRGVDVRLALNENMVVPDHVDEMTETLASAAPQARVRATRRNPAVIHEKILLIDEDEALLIGSPFQQRYWDNPTHAPDQPCRGGDGPPHHDVSVRLRGPAVAHVSEEFARIWNGSPTPATADPSDRWSCTTAAEARPAEGDVTLQLLLTTPVLGDMPPERTILEAFERTMAQAERFVYAENQYFTSERAARAIAKALDAHDGLEVILLLNEHMDIPGYDAVQAARIADLAGSYGERIGIFNAYTSGERGGRRGVLPIYIHSKTTLADDASLCVGSANLDGVSLEGATELGMPDALNEEANIHVVDGIEGAPRTGTVRALRQTLWSEHLGMPPEDLVHEPAEGWLSLWRAVAARNERTLLDGSYDLRGRIVPMAPDIPRQLRLDK